MHLFILQAFPEKINEVRSARRGKLQDASRTGLVSSPLTSVPMFTTAVVAGCGTYRSPSSPFISSVVSPPTRGNGRPESVTEIATRISLARSSTDCPKFAPSLSAVVPGSRRLS